MSDYKSLKYDINIHKFKKIVKFNKHKRLECLIIDPGPLYNSLIKEFGIHSTYSFSILNLESLSIDDIYNLINKYDFILIDDSGDKKVNFQVLSLLNSIKLTNYPIYDLIYFYEFLTGRIPILILSDHWHLNNKIITSPLKKSIFAFKRFFDILIVILLSPLVTILLLISFLLVKIVSKGPFIFKQERVGKDGLVFNLYKIRTMNIDDISINHHTVVNDSRVFPLGKILRKTKIDELPQFLNILLGQMSLIGPRPEQVDIVKSLSNENPYYQLRHIIRPGITGWAQIHKPTATPKENLQKLEYDLYYIKNINFKIEFEIIIKTLKVILTLNSL